MNFKRTRRISESRIRSDARGATPLTTRCIDHVNGVDAVRGKDALQFREIRGGISEFSPSLFALHDDSGDFVSAAEHARGVRNAPMCEEPTNDRTPSGDNSTVMEHDIDIVDDGCFESSTCSNGTESLDVATATKTESKITPLDDASKVDSTLKKLDELLRGEFQ